MSTDGIGCSPIDDCVSDGPLAAPKPDVILEVHWRHIAVEDTAPVFFREGWERARNFFRNKIVRLHDLRSIGNIKISRSVRYKCVSNDSCMWRLSLMSILDLSEVVSFSVQQIGIPHGCPLRKGRRLRWRHRTFTVELVRILRNSVGEMRAAQLEILAQRSGGPGGGGQLVLQLSSKSGKDNANNERKQRMLM